ncbi:MAG: hypothetical protein N2379_04010 [Verrucomicrobiae bacterium]|nr:hypothetical protein [Verrucomicrobiae bacterium]
MDTTVLAYGIEFVVQTAFLFTALLVMIKLQKLNYRLLPLAGAAALASALDMIPAVGHFIAVGALLLCIWKITESEYVDVAFTVFVGYALTFGMNLFLLSALIGDLRPSAQPDEAELACSALVAEYQADASDSSSAFTETDPIPDGATASGANEPRAGAISSNVNGVDSSTTGTAADAANEIRLKGLIQNAAKPALLVDTGVKTYTLVLGETATVRTPRGQARICFEELAGKQVLLKIDGKPVRLSL